MRPASIDKEGTITVENNPEGGKKKNTFNAVSFIMCILICLIVSVSSLAVYDRYYSQKIVYIDIKAFMDDQRAKYIAQKITGDKFKNNVDHIKEIVEKLPGNYVVMLNLPAEGGASGRIIVRNAVTVELER